MKLFFVILVFFLFNYTLNAKVFSFFFENDVVDGKDKHYTNGSSFVYISNKDTNNTLKYDNSFYKFLTNIPTFHEDTKYQSFGFNYSHLAFTPANTKEKNKIVGDVPYAGVITFDFILYKWEEDFFHEYMLTLGMVGPSTKTKQAQNSFHKIIGANKAQGWGNQLKDDFLYNLSYTYGYRAYEYNFKRRNIDITNNITFNFGNYARDIQVGANIRYGKNYPKTFNTVGRFIGSNENKLLNAEPKKNRAYAWSISYGIAYTYNDYFYITDFDKSYQNPKIRDIISSVASLDMYYDNYIFSLNFKSSKFLFNHDEYTKSNWGGFNIVYLF